MRVSRPSPLAACSKVIKSVWKFPENLFVEGGTPLAFSSLIQKYFKSGAQEKSASVLFLCGQFTVAATLLET